MKVSIVIPCFNEKGTIAALIGKVVAVELPHEKEIVVIDDGSTDGGCKGLLQAYSNHNLKIITHTKNLGRGAALRSALEHVSGEVVIIQDGDLEYEPADYPMLLEPIFQNRADMVYGSRFMGTGPWRGYWINYFFNRLVSFIARRITKLETSDILNGNKVYRSELLKNARLSENRFGIDIELAFRVAAKHPDRFIQIPTRYTPRTYRDGKKIGALDALNMIRLILQYSLLPAR